MWHKLILATALSVKAISPRNVSGAVVRGTRNFPLSTAKRLRSHENTDVINWCCVVGMHTYREHCDEKIDYDVKFGD